LSTSIGEEAGLEEVETRGKVGEFAGDKDFAEILAASEGVGFTGDAAGGLKLLLLLPLLRVDDELPGVDAEGDVAFPILARRFARI
jgi:hypothetical protein